MSTKLLARMTKRIGLLEEFAVVYTAARSKVDERQPFFMTSKKVIILKQKFD